MQQCARVVVVCKLNPVDALQLVKRMPMTPPISQACTDFFLLELQGISVRMQQCARAQVVCKLNPVDALRLIKGTSITPSI